MATYLPIPAPFSVKIPLGKTEIQQEVFTQIPQFLIRNAKKIKKIVYADLDNWPKLFDRFPFSLPNGTFVWGFYGLKPWRPPKNVTSYLEVIKAGMFHLQYCGNTKDAADGAIFFAVIEMNNHRQLPKEISFVLVSGDKIFICEAIQRCMDQSVREIVLVDPHKILREYKEEAQKKIKEYPGEAHKILREYHRKAYLRIYNEIFGTEVTGGKEIESSVVRKKEVNQQALIASMKLLYMYLLDQEEIPSTTILQHLMDVTEDLGVDVLTFQKKGGKAKKASQRHIDYLVNLFGRQIWEELREEILASSFYSVMVDETTDISTTLEFVIYFRYLQNGKSKTVFGGVINISDGKADTIMAAITDFLLEKEIPIGNMVAFGSDGAAVMVSSKTGVGTQLKSQVPHLLTNHCVAHQLALASAQAASSIPYLTKFNRIVEQLLQFYAYRRERMSDLQEIQTLLNELKITEAKDVRWLSHDDRVVKAILKCLPNLLTSLDREASERTEAQAQGLLSFMQTYDFVAALYMFSDILPVLSDLYCSFQTEDGAYANVGNKVTGTIATIRALGERPGKHFSRLTADTERTKFEENVYRKFIAAVVENLQERFPDIPLLEAFSAFNVQQWPDTDQDLMVYGGDSIQTLAGHLRPILGNAEDIPMEYSKLKTRGEKKVVNQRKVTTQRIMEKVAGPLSTTLPNLAIIATVGLLIPTATTQCERAFSTLSRVMTKLRSRPNNSTLNPLLMILMEGPDVLKFNYDKAVSTYIIAKKRRL